MKKTCPNCKKIYTPDLATQPNFEEKLVEWQGRLIQNVWPEATLIQREQLMTGVCSDKCWAEYLGPLNV